MSASMIQVVNLLCHFPRKASRKARQTSTPKTEEEPNVVREKDPTIVLTMGLRKSYARGQSSIGIQPGRRSYQYSGYEQTATHTDGTGTGVQTRDNRPPVEYNAAVEAIREHEYPHMNEGAYLDHGGATIYAQSLIQSFSHSMATGLYGNPHSQNAPAMRSGDLVDRCREKTLRFLGADPEHFDLIFVANATAAIKLVADCFRDMAEGTRTGTFWYGYHRDCHTSLVGVRQLTNGSYWAFENDDQVEEWLGSEVDGRMIRRDNPGGLGLFAYPGQSNLNGRRLPKAWLRKVKENPSLRNTYTLFDAAALAMTSSLADLFSDPQNAPDFTCLSFYKVFGFPDVGALVVRRDSGHILSGSRKYFGGGTISVLDAFGKGLGHRIKGVEERSANELHEGLEDGTLPFHSILALDIAIDTHKKLYGSMDVISRHTAYLARLLFEGVSQMRYPNGAPVVEVYANDHPDGGNAFGDTTRQGSTMAFNILGPDGSYVQWTELEKLANEEKVFIRAGGVCCPGGVFSALKYEQWEWDRMFSAGHRCGSARPLVHEKPTGIVRASLGAMSTKKDVQAFLSFIQKIFLEQCGDSDAVTMSPAYVSKESFDLHRRSA